MPTIHSNQQYPILNFLSKLKSTIKNHPNHTNSKISLIYKKENDTFYTISEKELLSKHQKNSLANDTFEKMYNLIKEAFSNINENELNMMAWPIYEKIVEEKTIEQLIENVKTHLNKITIFKSIKNDYKTHPLSQSEYFDEFLHSLPPSSFPDNLMTSDQNTVYETRNKIIEQYIYERMLNFVNSTPPEPPATKEFVTSGYVRSNIINYINLYDDNNIREFILTLFKEYEKRQLNTFLILGNFFESSETDSIDKFKSKMNTLIETEPEKIYYGNSIKYHAIEISLEDKIEEMQEYLNEKEIDFNINNPLSKEIIEIIAGTKFHNENYYNLDKCHAIEIVGISIIFSDIEETIQYSITPLDDIYGTLFFKRKTIELLFEWYHKEIVKDSLKNIFMGEKNLEELIHSLHSHLIRERKFYQ